MITKLKLGTLSQHYLQTIDNVFRILSFVVINNPYTKKRFLNEIVKLPKVVWRFNSTLFYRMLLDLFKDFPLSTHLINNEERPILIVVDTILKRYEEAINEKTGNMKYEQMRVLRAIISTIQWPNKTGIIKKIFEHSGAKLLINDTIDLIEYYGGTSTNNFAEIKKLFEKTL
jgi:hypothetical protein